MYFPLLSFAKGDFPGTSMIKKFGRNPDIDIASGFETLWNGGGAYTGHDATGAETISVVSDDAADDITGTGARTVELFGLDGSGVQITEVVSLDGVTPAVSTATFKRMDRIIVRSAGSGAENAGEITATQSSAGHVMAKVPVGYNQTMIAAYTIPAAFNGFMIDWFAALSGPVIANCRARLRHRPEGEVFQVKEEIAVIAGGTSLNTREFIVPFGPIAPGTDIFVECDSSANNASVAGGFELLMLPV